MYVCICLTVKNQKSYLSIYLSIYFSLIVKDKKSYLSIYLSLTVKNKKKLCMYVCMYLSIYLSQSLPKEKAGTLNFWADVWIFIYIYLFCFVFFSFTNQLFFLFSMIFPSFSPPPARSANFIYFPFSFFSSLSAPYSSFPLFFSAKFICFWTFFWRPSSFLTIASKKHWKLTRFHWNETCLTRMTKRLLLCRQRDRRWILCIMAKSDTSECIQLFFLLLISICCHNTAIIYKVFVFVKESYSTVFLVW